MLPSTLNSQTGKKAMTENTDNMLLANKLNAIATLSNSALTDGLENFAKGVETFAQTEISKDSQRIISYNMARTGSAAIITLTKRFEQVVIPNEVPLNSLAIETTLKAISMLVSNKEQAELVV